MGTNTINTPMTFVRQIYIVLRLCSLRFEQENRFWSWTFIHIVKHRLNILIKHYNVFCCQNENTNFPRCVWQVPQNIWVRWLLHRRISPCFRTFEVFREPLSLYCHCDSKSARCRLKLWMLCISFLIAELWFKSEKNRYSHFRFTSEFLYKTR